MAMGTSPYFAEQGLPGVAVIGENGILAINRSTWKVIPQTENGEFMTASFPERKSNGSGLDEHTKNFLECIKTRNQPNCTIEMGRNAALVAHLGNIAYRTGKKIEWNAQTQKSTASEVNAFLKPQYRTPWVLPG
jgi:hypothetical protein